MFEYYTGLYQSYGEGISLRTILCVVALTIFIKYVMKLFQRDPRFERFAKQLPGPYALPLVGNGIDFLRNMGESRSRKLWDVID